MTYLRKMRLGVMWSSLFASVLSACLAGRGVAQTAATSLRGDVSDSMGALIPNVEVTISESSIGFTETHQTDDKGAYSFQQRQRRCVGSRARNALKISNDPESRKKWKTSWADLNPPEHALVLCMGESQMQAWDRTQPGLPLKLRRGQTMTHDYKCNRTATLFAALNVASGEVFGLCQELHRHQEWLKFLRLAGAEHA